MLHRWGDRHRRLLARLGVVLFATLAIDVVGTVLIYFFERHADGHRDHVVRRRGCSSRRFSC